MLSSSRTLLTDSDDVFLCLWLKSLPMYSGTVLHPDIAVFSATRVVGHSILPDPINVMSIISESLLCRLPPPFLTVGLIPLLGVLLFTCHRPSCKLLLFFPLHVTMGLSRPPYPWESIECFVFGSWWYLEPLPAFAPLVIGSALPSSSAAPVVHVASALSTYVILQAFNLSGFISYTELSGIHFSHKPPTFDVSEASIVLVIGPPPTFSLCLDSLENSEACCHKSI